MNETIVIIIAAAIAGGLFVIVIVGLAIFLLVHRRRKRAAEAAKITSNGHSDLGASPYGISVINTVEPQAAVGIYDAFKTDSSGDDASGFEIYNYETTTNFNQLKASNVPKVLPKLPAKPAKMSDINHAVKPESSQVTSAFYERLAVNNFGGPQNHDYSQKKANNENVYNELPTLSAPIDKSSSASNINQPAVTVANREEPFSLTLGKAIKPLPAFPIKQRNSTFLIHPLEINNLKLQKPLISAKPLNLQTTANNSDNLIQLQKNSHKVRPAIPAKPNMIATLSEPGKSNNFENHAKNNSENQRPALRSIPKFSPPVPPKPKSKVSSNQNLRGKDNQGFVSDDSGYTTVDSTVHSVDSSLYWSRKLKQNWEKSNERRIHVSESNKPGPYAVIDIFDHKAQNKAPLPPSAGDPSQLAIANFLLNINRQNGATGYPPKAPEHFYFELEKQNETADSDRADADLYNANSRTSVGVSYLSQLKETDV